MDQLLKQFGFSDGEMTVYKSLLKSGGVKVSEVANDTQIKRTSCQEYVQSLEKKGFINSTKLGSKYYYQAEDPDKFRQVINERQFVLGKILADLKQRKNIEQWNVQASDLEKIQRDMRRAKRKGQELVEFGDNIAGGALLNGSTISLFSNDKELPVIEIRSKALYRFHADLLRKKDS